MGTPVQRPQQRRVPNSGAPPTAASVDAMAILGEGFDGDWYGSGSFDDYFITQWGPERQDIGKGDYWGVVVNNVFTSIGGCQYQVDGGDEVLWVYDAFDGRPRLVLYPGAYARGSVELTAAANLGGPFAAPAPKGVHDPCDGRPRLVLYPGASAGGSVELTAEANLGEPFEVTVLKWGHECCTSTPPPSPTRSTAPFESAEVGPVVSTVRGFERIDTASADTVETGADGTATITFDESGWHRIKATDLTAGNENAVRSNRLDVCVLDPPTVTACVPPTASDDLVRVHPPNGLEEEPGPEGAEGEPKEDRPGGNGSQPTATPPTFGPPAPETAQAKVALRGLDRSRIAAGIVGISWRVQDAGAGISKWSVAAKRLGRKGARFVIRASGKAGSSAQVRLPRGARYTLRLTFTDPLGRSSSVGLGTVRVPG